MKLSPTFATRRANACLFFCLMVMLTACSSSTTGEEETAFLTTPSSSSTTSTTEAVAETTTSVLAVTPPTPPGSLTPEEAVEACPSVESLSSAAGLPLTGVEATVSEVDLLASDPESETTLCVYQADESTALLVRLHTSPINNALFLETPLPDATVDELSSGAIQIQFDGQAGCEIYDDRVSLILATDGDFADSCATVIAAREAVQ